MYNQVLTVCTSGNLSKLVHLHKTGHDIHFENEYPLQLCCLYGFFEMAQYLINNGANIRAHKDMAFRWACVSGHLNIVQLLMHKSNNEIPIDRDSNYVMINACCRGDLNMIKYFMSIKDTLNYNNYTPLIVAAQNDHMDIVQYFLSFEINSGKLSLSALLFHQKIKMYVYISSHFQDYELDESPTLDSFHLLLCSFTYSKNCSVQGYFFQQDELWDPNIGLVISSFMFE